MKIHEGNERQITTGAIWALRQRRWLYSIDHYFIARIGEKVSEEALPSVETEMLQVLFYLHGQHHSSNEDSTASL